MMSISDFLKRQVQELLLGDRPSFGRLRFLSLVIVPLVVLLSSNLRSFLFGGFSALVLQLLLLYFLGLLSAFAAGVAYIKDIYELDSDRMPFHHLISSFLGLLVPRISVSNRLQDGFGKDMVETIGGPAYLNVAPGYAVLTETLTAPAQIYGPGKQFISRQERVQEFVELHEQEGKIPDVNAITRDGISVTVENIRFLYRLWDSQWESDPAVQARALNPFPYSKDAIHKLVYSRTVSVDDQGNQKRFSWGDAMRGQVAGIIKKYITEHRLDEVIASREHEQENPRVTIWKKAYETDFKKGLRSMGTILRWWDPGEFKSLATIEKQFLSNWSVDISNRIQLNKAHGDAQKQAYEELGRAEAEAELLMSIINSLEGIKLAPDKPHTLQNLILMRTAQVIRALNTPAQEARPKDSEEQDKKKQVER